MTNEEKQSSDKNVLRDPDHSFDGIQEYDNDMPRWWVNLFIVSVFFGVGYFAWYHLPIFPSKSLQDEYAEAKAELEERRQAIAADSVGGGDLTLTDLVKDESLVAEGKATFESNCLACHAADGGGLVGPNLTDNYWIHGTTYDQLYAVIAKGVLEKGMPAWEEVIGAGQIKASLAYIMSLQGTTPASPKAPEGQEGILQ